MDFKELLHYFLPNEEFVASRRFGNGHINSTYLFMTLKNEYYIVQRINDYVFKDVDMLMNNIVTVSNHLKSKNIESIEMIKASNGKYYVEYEGSYFRMYRFLEETFTYESPEGMKTVENAAMAFGKFHNYLSDLDATKLGETIPHFHDTPKRYNDLQIAIKEDKLNRVKSCKREIDIINKYVPEYSLIVDGIAAGEVKLHITHNDPKINNALFDYRTKAYRSIIDLDTVMPGSVLYDFGDALRSLFTGDKEDSKDYKKVVGKTEIFKHYLQSYYNEAKNFLTDAEIELFPFAPFILTMECGIRFLEDYLKGDVYFRTKYAGQNLDRARTQINLAQSIISNIHKYKKIVKKITGK